MPSIKHNNILPIHNVSQGHKFVQLKNKMSADSKKIGRNAYAWNEGHLLLQAPEDLKVYILPNIIFTEYIYLKTIGITLFVSTLNSY